MELIEEMKKIISVQDKNLLNNLFEEYHPVDLGIESEDLEEDELRILVKNITHENLALLLESSEEELDAKIMSFFTNDELIEIFTHMEH